MNEETTELRAETELEARETYFANAQTWAEDRNDTIFRSRRTAWIIAGIAAAIAVMEALALIALTPLKTVVTQTLLVDRTTGFVQKLDSDGAQALRPTEALTQSMLAQYVIARETFDIATISDQYRKVALWSADNARRDYLALMPQSNPASPINRNSRSTVLTTEIESVSPLNPKSALVRFRTERREGGQLRGAPEYWVAILGYRFSAAPLAVEDRIINPLGFQVLHYRRDQEAPPRGDVQADAANEQVQAAAPPTVPARPRIVRQTPGETL